MGAHIGHGQGLTTIIMSQSYENALKMIEKHCKDCDATHPDGYIECGHCAVLVDWLPGFERGCM